MENENIAKAVAILDEAKSYAVEQLKNEPMLNIRVTNTLETLINGLKHVGGFVGDVSTEAGATIKPAKSFMGLDLEALDQQSEPAEVNVLTDEKEQYRTEVNALYEGFLDRDEVDLKDSLTREQLLGVAKLAGITVDEPSKQNVTLKLIREVKAAIEDKNQVEAERLAKIQALDNEKEDGKEGEEQ